MAEGLQLISEISVSYLLADNELICILCMQCMISYNNITSGSLLGVTWCYMMLHGVTWCYMALHSVSRCYMVLQHDIRVLHGVTGCCTVLQGAI